MRDLDKVMTAAEAAEKWGKAPITIQQACMGYKGAPPPASQMMNVEKQDVYG